MPGFWVNLEYVQQHVVADHNQEVLLVKVVKEPLLLIISVLQSLNQQLVKIAILKLVQHIHGFNLEYGQVVH